MSAIPSAAPVEPEFGHARTDLARYGLAFVATLSLHAGLGAYLASTRPEPRIEPNDAPAVVMIDLAPPPAASALSPTASLPGESNPEPAESTPDPVPEAPPDPPPPELEAKPAAAEPAPPVEPVPVPVETTSAPPEISPALPVAPSPAVETAPVMAPPAPVKARPEPISKLKPVKAADSRREHRTIDPKPAHPVRAKVRVEPREARPPAQAAGARTVSSASSAASGSAAASSSAWRSQLAAYLQRNLRYPPGSRSGGAASVSFSMNRQGRVLSAALARSAGSSELDAAALELFRRGSLPPPPPDVPGATFSFTIPVRFNTR